MGRPKGSKNKPKVIVPATTPAATQPQAEEARKRVKPAAAKPAKPAEAPLKRKGRPPGSKNKDKQEAAAVAAPPVQTAKLQAPAPIPIPPPAVTIVRTNEGEETDGGSSAREVDTRAGYTAQDLSSPALQPLEDAIAPLVALISPKRRLYYEERALPGVSFERQVLKTFLDYFEVDVKKLVAKG